MRRSPPSAARQQIAAADTSAGRRNRIGTPCAAMACRRRSTSSRSLISRRIRVNWLPPFSSAEAQLVFMPRVLQHLATFQLKLTQIGHPLPEAGTQPLLAVTACLSFCPAKLTSRAWILSNLASASATKPRIAVRFRIQNCTDARLRHPAQKPDLRPPTKSSGLSFSIPCSLRFTVQRWSLKAIMAEPYVCSYCFRRYLHRGR